MNHVSTVHFECFMADLVLYFFDRGYFNSVSAVMEIYGGD